MPFAITITKSAREVLLKCHHLDGIKVILTPYGNHPGIEFVVRAGLISGHPAYQTLSVCAGNVHEPEEVWLLSPLVLEHRRAVQGLCRETLN